jgi:SulP family sulfate permease
MRGSLASLEFDCTFTFKVARRLRIETEIDASAGGLTHRVSGQVFFASVDVFIDAFDVNDAEGMKVRYSIACATSHFASGSKQF